MARIGAEWTRNLKHRRIEIGRGQGRVQWQGIQQPPRDDACAGGRLQYRRWFQHRQTPGDVLGVVDKYHRPESLIVVIRYVAYEPRRFIRHGEPSGKM